MLGNGSAQERLGLDRNVQATKAGLQLPDTLSFEAWQRIGRQLKIVSNSATWWLADWLIFGEEAFPNRYRKAIAETGLDYQTLRNYAWIARKFPMSRRRDKLSLQHHAEAAALPPEEQASWLDMAERENWSVKRLRREVRASRQEALGSAHSHKYLTLELEREREARWQAAAKNANATLLDWIVLILDEAAGQHPSTGEKR